MNFTLRERVEIVADLLIIIDAHRLDELWKRLHQWFREHHHGLRRGGPYGDLDSEGIAGHLSKLTGSKHGPWKDAALEWLGFPDRESVAVELIREMADAIRDEQSEWERRNGVTIPRPTEPAPPRPNGPAPIHVTVGQRKRGGR